MQDINLYHLLNFYAKKWKLVVLLTAIGAFAGFAYNNYLQVPLYKSDATLLLVNTDSAKVAQNTTLINNYIELLKSRRVLEPVLKAQHDVMTYDELAGATTATNDKGTEVIKVSIATKNADTSKKLADGVVSSFRDEVKNIYNLDNVSIVDNASTATDPYNVHKAMFIALASAAGFFLSIIGLFFVYDLATSAKNEVVEVKTKIKAKAQTTVVKKKPTPKKKVSSRPTVKKVVDLIVGNETQHIAPKKKAKQPKTTKRKK